MICFYLKSLTYKVLISPLVDPSISVKVEVKGQVKADHLRGVGRV